MEDTTIGMWSRLVCSNGFFGSLFCLNAVVSRRIDDALNDSCNHMSYVNNYTSHLSHRLIEPALFVVDEEELALRSKNVHIGCVLTYATSHRVPSVIELPSSQAHVIEANLKWHIRWGSIFFSLFSSVYFLHRSNTYTAHLKQARARQGSLRC